MNQTRRAKAGTKRGDGMSELYLEFYDEYIDYYVANGDPGTALAMMWKRKAKRERG